MKKEFLGKKKKRVETTVQSNDNLPDTTNFFKDEIVDTENPQSNVDPQYTNRQRVLVVASRGVSKAERVLVNNIISLLPHAKKECKIERKVAKEELNEICFINSCSSCLYFESKKKEFCLWAFRSPEGPTLKFQISSLNTLDEPKLSGNCLKYSRPILSFDGSFDSLPHMDLIKEIFTHIFNTPKNHPKSKPFYDHIESFFNLNNTIYFRNYQLINELKDRFCTEDDADKLQLIEIGPRITLKLIKIFDGVMGGKTLYLNPYYIPPGEIYKRNAIKFKERAMKLMIKENELNEKHSTEVNLRERWMNGEID